MMDSKILREAALSYLAVYDTEIRDRMEELGMISEDDTYYEAREPGVTRVVRGPGEPQSVTLPRRTQSEEFDVYDVVLTHLLDEGYAETLESAEAIMVNMSEEWIDTIIDEEVEQLDEISKGTAIRAYALGRSSEFEGQDSPEQVERNNRLIGRIKRKFGPDTAEHAEKAADAKTFGRGTPRPLSKPMSSNQRTTKTGKLHKRAQQELKNKLEARRASRRRGDTSVQDRPSFYNP